MPAPLDESAADCVDVDNTDSIEDEYGHSTSSDVTECCQKCLSDSKCTHSVYTLGRLVKLRSCWPVSHVLPHAPTVATSDEWDIVCVFLIRICLRMHYLTHRIAQLLAEEHES